MADQAITALPKKTYSGSSKIAATDYLLGIDSAEGYQMLIQDLGEYIINRVTASLAGSNQTLAAAISALNSKMRTIASGSLRDIKTSGIYYLTGTVTDKPANNGGYYSVSVYNNDLLFGLYATLDGSVFCVEFINGSWKYTQLATDSDVPSQNYLDYWTVYPNGKLYNKTYFTLTIPFFNSKNKTPSVSSAYVYNDTGSFVDIKSSVTIETANNLFVYIQVIFDAGYAGRLARFTITLS